MLSPILLVSGCCERVTVEYTVGSGAFGEKSNDPQSNDNVMRNQNSYVLGEGTINGHNYYISEDGIFVISFRTCGNWAFHWGTRMPR